MDIQGRERDLIIDTGFGLTSISAAITEISTRPIIAVCTHSHHDHAGGLCQFENRCGHHSEAKIFAEPSRKAIVADLLEMSTVHVVCLVREKNKDRLVARQRLLPLLSDCMPAERGGPPPR